MVVTWLLLFLATSSAIYAPIYRKTHGSVTKCSVLFKDPKLWTKLLLAMYYLQHMDMYI